MTFITATTVATITGFASDKAFLRARDRLEREDGFPPPMPTCQRPLIWRRDAIEAWAAEQGTPCPVPTGPNVILLAEARRA